MADNAPVKGRVRARGRAVPIRTATDTPRPGSRRQQVGRISVPVSDASTIALEDKPVESLGEGGGQLPATEESIVHRQSDPEKSQYDILSVSSALPPAVPQTASFPSASSESIPKVNPYKAVLNKVKEELSQNLERQKVQGSGSATTNRPYAAFLETARRLKEEDQRKDPVLPE